MISLEAPFRRTEAIAWHAFRLIAALIATLPAATAAEVIPPAPRDHVHDEAGLLESATEQQLNAELVQFERETSNQVVVATFPRMQSDSSVEVYTVRVAQAWGVGQRERRNGAVLFVFQESRDIRIVTGYGMEGALPDALAKQIIENEMIPRFRAGDFDGGIVAGTRAMLAATRGEYRGSGRTAADGRGGGAAGGSGLVGFIVLMIVLALITRSRARRGLMYGRRGRRVMWGGPWGGGGFGGGFGGGGGWGGGGGGTFSGGGGSFGGGGAGGRW